MTIDFQTVYGIEYSGGRISVVKARRRRGTVEHEVLLDDVDPAAGSAWINTAAQISEARKQGRSAVAFAVMASDSFIRPVEAPFDSPAKARAVLPSLLDVQLPFPLEQCVYAFGQLEPVAGGKRLALAAAMLKQRLQKIIEDISAIGVDPELMVPEALAIWQYQSVRVPPVRPGARVVLHLASDRTLAVAGSGSRPTSSFSSRTGWSGADAGSREKLVARLRQFIAGFTRGESASFEMIVSGPGAASADSLAADLGIDRGQWKNADAPALMAAAIACFALDPGGLPSNLRHGELESPSLQIHRRRSDRLSFALVAYAAVFLVLVAAGARYAVRERLVQLDAEVGAVAREITGGGRVEPYQELYSVRNHPVVGAWLNPVVQPLFAGVVEAAAKANVALESVAVGTKEAMIRGYGTGWNDAAVVTNAIADRTPWMINVERSDAGPDEKVHFVVRASP